VTVSLSSNPLDAKDARVWDRSSWGEGISFVARSKKELELSPTSTQRIEWTTSLKFKVLVSF
jgi:hypothetical protein